MTVHDFATGLGSAAWSMNFHRFCEVIGNEEDDYAKDKFRDFQQLARLLGRFDDHTLTLLLRAQGVEA
jgi:hypothetical protein